MNINFKKIFGIATIVGTAIVGISGVGKEVTKYKEENPKDDPLDDGHVPSPEEAAELAANYGLSDEDIIEDIIESTEEVKEENKD